MRVTPMLTATRAKALLEHGISDARALATASRNDVSAALLQYESFELDGRAHKQRGASGGGVGGSDAERRERLAASLQKEAKMVVEREERAADAKAKECDALFAADASDLALYQAQ